MSQISIGNVLAVHGLLAAQAERMQVLPEDSSWLRSIEAVGGDPVSLVARHSFQHKINDMLTPSGRTTGSCPRRPSGCGGRRASTATPRT